MLELYQETLKPHNLPFTVLLLLVFVYWLVAIIGVVDLDVSFDLDVDADVDEGAGKLFSSMVKLTGLAEVPAIFIASVFAVLMWAINLLANQFFNPDSSIKIALILAVLTIIISFIFTRLLVRPLAPLAELLTGSELEAEILGAEATVTTSSITNDFGRVEVPFDGRSILLNAILSEGVEPLAKGAKVLVVSKLENADTYIVRPLTT